MTEIPEDELSCTCCRAAGPGGQGVNTTDSAVQLRFDAAHSRILDEAVRKRLLQLAGSRATAAGEIVITAAAFRSQRQNRLAALARLQALIQAARHPPRPRRRTAVPGAQKRQRRENKARRAALKQSRRTRHDHSPDGE